MSRSVHDLVQGLLQLSESLASPQPVDDRLQDLCRITARLLGCDRSSIFLLREGYYRAAYNFGNPPDVAERFPKHRVRLDDPLILRAMEQRRHGIVNDAQHSLLMNRETAERARIRAMVAGPLV